MQLKHYLLTGIVAASLIGLGGVAAFTYMGKRIAQLLAFQQEAALEEWGELAFQAYQSEAPDTGVWVLKKYLDKVDSIYSVMPMKNREYYYLSFVAHARLAKLYKLRGASDFETNEIRLATEASIGWSSDKKTNEASIFESLAKIDEIDRKHDKVEQTP